jgi:hypothetical protein
MLSLKNNKKPQQEVFYAACAWLGIRVGNQTFEDELDFDISELEPIFDEPDEEAK